MLDVDNAPEFCRGEFVVNRRDLVVEWGHCDPAGIVFHPRFIEFFDWSCIALFEAATGLSQVGLKRNYGLAGIPIVDLEARFLRPVGFDDHVQVFTTLEAIGNSSLKYRHCLTKGGEVAVECRQTRVWCGHDPKDGSLRGQPVPAELAAKLRRG